VLLAAITDDSPPLITSRRPQVILRRHLHPARHIALRVFEAVRAPAEDARAAERSEERRRWAKAQKGISYIEKERQTYHMSAAMPEYAAMSSKECSADMSELLSRHVS